MRVRTVRLPDDRYRHIYVVRQPGPRGGHTVAGESHKRKEVGGKVKADTEPEYRMKPNTGGIRRGKK